MNSLNLLIGNVCSLLAMITDSVSAGMFAAFNGALFNVVGVITNSVVSVTTVISLVKDARNTPAS